MLQRAVGLCVCQCQVLSGSRFKANSKDKGESEEGEGNWYIAQRVLVGQRTFNCVTLQSVEGSEITQSTWYQQGRARNTSIHFGHCSYFETVCLSSTLQKRNPESGLLMLLQTEHFGNCWCVTWLKVMLAKRVSASLTKTEFYCEQIFKYRMTLEATLTEQ